MTFASLRRSAHVLLLALLGFLLASMAWPVLAGADALVPTVPPDEQPLLELARIVYEGVTTGGLSGWLVAVTGALVITTRVLRGYGAQLVPWLATGVGGAALVFVGSLGGAMLTAVLGGAAPSWSIVWYAAGIAFFAAGGYTTIKHAVIEPLRPRAASWPTFARLLFRLVSWIADRPQTPSSRASTAPIVGVMLLVIAGAVVGCTAHQREVARAGAGAGADTALRCQSDSLAGLALEAYELARHYLVSTISGAGEVDTTAIRIAARQVRTDAGRCAFAAALAAVTEAMSQRKGALGVGPSPAYVLRRTLGEVARDDWQRVVEIDGELVVQ